MEDQILKHLYDIREAASARKDRTLKHSSSLWIDFGSGFFLSPIALDSGWMATQVLQSVGTEHCSVPTVLSLHVCGHENRKEESPTPKGFSG